LKQREPYYVLIIIFIIFLLLGWQKKIWFYLLVQIIIIYGLFYSVWHVGIENKILPGPSSCSESLKISTDKLTLKEQILSKNIINCEEAVWKIFGLSAATINSLLLILIFLINVIYLINRYGTKKKEKN